MNKFEKAYLHIIKEDFNGDLEEMWQLQKQGEKECGEWDYPANRPQPGEALPNEEELWKQKIEIDKKICKWNQEHNRCCTPYCSFAYCQNDAYDIWRCNIADNAGTWREYKERTTGKRLTKYSNHIDKDIKTKVAKDPVKAQFIDAFHDWLPLGKEELFAEGKYFTDELYFSWGQDEVSIYLQKDNKIRVESKSHKETFPAGAYEDVKKYIEERYTKQDF